MAFDPKGKTNKELLEARAKLVTEARSYLEANESSWSKECEEKYNTMISDTSDITAALERRKALENIEAKREQARITPDDPSVNPSRSAEGKKKTIAIRTYTRSGKPEYKFVEVGSRGSDLYEQAFARTLKSGLQGLHSDLANVIEMSALQSDSPEQAGYLLASEQFAAGILKEVDDLLFVRRYAKIHTVMEAGSLGIRKRTARMNTFGWSAELEVKPEDQNLKYGKKVLTPHHLTGMIKLSRDLVRRSMQGVVSEVQYEMARDAGEKMEDGYLTGNGAQQPLGVFTASADGISTARDVNTGSATGFTSDGLVNAKYALKAQYRTGLLGAVRWLFHRDAIKEISKLKLQDDQYLWQPGLQQGQPDLLLGYPIDESERVPNTFTNGLYSGLLANWNYYEIADSLDMEVQVLFERYAETNQIGYIGRLKTDGMPTIEEAFVRLKCAT
jgi:HK97 family phage major capsid protein